MSEAAWVLEESERGNSRAIGNERPPVSPVHRALLETIKARPGWLSLSVTVAPRVEALILTADDPERGLLTTKTTAELCERLGLTRNEIQKMLYAARDAGLILGISCWKEREGNLLAQAATHWFIKPAETPSADVHTEGALERAPGEEEGALEGALEGAPGEVEGAHTRARVALLASSSSSSSSYVEEVEVLSSTKSKQAELLERESLEGDDPFAVELGGGLLIDHTVTR